MTMTMIERVAIAIWNANRPSMAPPYDELDALDKDRVQIIARACIEAMREPTPAMTEAVWATEMDGNAWGAWEVMIDAALNEKEVQ